LQVGGLSFGVAHCNERMHPLCLKLSAVMEKFCTTMERKKPPIENVKNLWNEKGIRLRIKLMKWDKKCVKLEV
jgi:hypothetical protein